MLRSWGWILSSGNTDLYNLQLGWGLGLENDAQLGLDSSLWQHWPLQSAAWLRVWYGKCCAAGAGFFALAILTSTICSLAESLVWKCCLAWARFFAMAVVILTFTIFSLAEDLVWKMLRSLSWILGSGNTDLQLGWGFCKGNAAQLGLDSSLWPQNYKWKNRKLRCIYIVFISK